jgi:hypothetical protein
VARKISVEIVGDSRSVERAFKRAGGAGSRFGSALKTVGKTAALGFGAAIVGVGFALKRGFGELAEAQKVAAQTNAVLRSTGGVANVTGKHVDRLATAISRKTGIDDEAIAAAQNMLLTFTNVHNEVGKGNKIFDMATKAVIDLAVAAGRDPVDAAIMLGKALNDLEVNQKGTITGWSALRRVGVRVTADMMAQAAAFIKAGKPMEAQKILLRELATEFGGSAKAFGTTMPGALGKLRNAFDELMAAFASGFLPLILKVAKTLTTKLADPAFVQRVRELGTLIGTKLYNAFAVIGTWVAEHWPQIQQGFRTTGTIIGGIVEGMGKLVEAFKTAAPVLAALIQHALVTPMKLALTVWSGILEALTHIPLIGGKFKGALGAVNAAREGVRGIEQGLERAQAREQQRRNPRTAAQAAARGIVPGQGRARGGPVMAGMAYRVGERGPETLVMGGQSGYVSPNGGGIHIGTVVLPGVTNAREFLRELQRLNQSSSSSRSGRFGGRNPATALG